MKKTIILFLCLFGIGFSQELYLNNNTVHIDSVGVITGGYIGAGAYLTETDTTITTNADTWYRMEGTFNNFISERFSFVNDTLNYTNGTYWFIVLGAATITSDIVFTNVKIGISINGLDPESYSQTLFKLDGAGTFYTCPLISLTELNNNDKIVIVVSSDKTGAKIIIDSFMLTMFRVFR